MSRAATKPPASPPAAPAGIKVLKVDHASLAERAGMAAGDYLVAMNSHPIGDVIDYWFHSAAERLKLEWRAGGPDGPPKQKTLRKAFHERIGLEVEPFEIKRCTNYCVFCFVHQLPTGLRRELYIKDEDFRLSFLYGNYITGTNLSQADMDRIVRMKLSPIYFSIHATDQQVREELLAKKNIPPIIPQLRWLTERGIFVHGQIVLCPGLNDGAVLEQTVEELSALHPALESIAVVPLGLTDHRARLPKLQEVTPEYARKFLKEIAKIQRKTKKAIGFPLVFPSDEFFLIAGLDPPVYSQYPEIPQLANGVGMLYRFYEHLEEICADLPESLPEPRRVAAITTTLGEQVLRRLVQELNQRVENLTVDILVTNNTLFGDGITVSGLLPGQDFLRMIHAHPGYDRYLIPENSLRGWDQRFLDDMTLEDLRQEAGVEIATGADTAESFVAAALGEALAAIPQ
ncbi:MAG: DUF512 domain-containing protein [Candidatus Sumerlaeaceae bacterium]|nr:DUF512 domain-containing protein [Candidatus Sumerlaeaceae bacterium]